MRHLPVVFVTALLAACPSGEDETSQIFCNSFGPSPSVTWTCNSGCSVVNPNAASDRDTGTATSLVPTTNATSEVATLQITGPDFASGATVGVFLTQPTSSGFVTSNVIETFLDGVAQETSDNNPERVTLTSDDWDGPKAFLGIETTKAFDSVRFTTTNSWPSGQAPVYEVYEICSDGGRV